ncbi:MAG TPA: metallophosphoesterase [Methanothrix sp.]|nr:metallophosphoesterase [Methanothrix sp.]HRW83636.1 metallophosphoesterase [Methanothrix sp.]
MKRIVAISDTHLEFGSEVPASLIDLARGADLLLHAGDFVSLEVYEAFSDLAPVEAVCGNSDQPVLKAALPDRRIVEVEDVRIGLVHRAARSRDLTGADFLAREMEVDALVFGHIHRPLVEEGPRLLVSPGSPTEPRLSPPAAAEIEVEGGEIRARIVLLGKPVCGYFKFAESLAEGSADGKEERRE